MTKEKKTQGIGEGEERKENQVPLIINQVYTQNILEISIPLWVLNQNHFKAVTLTLLIGIDKYIRSCNTDQVQLPFSPQVFSLLF